MDGTDAQAQDTGGSGGGMVDTEVSACISSLVKELGTLDKILRGILPLDSAQGVMGSVLRIYSDRLREEYGKMPLGMLRPRMRVRRDVAALLSFVRTLGPYEIYTKDLAALQDAAEKSG